MSPWQRRTLSGRPLWSNYIDLTQNDVDMAEVLIDMSKFPGGVVDLTYDDNEILPPSSPAQAMPSNSVDGDWEGEEIVIPFYDATPTRDIFPEEDEEIDGINNDNVSEASTLFGDDEVSANVNDDSGASTTATASPPNPNTTLAIAINTDICSICQDVIFDTTTIGHLIQCKQCKNSCHDNCYTAMRFSLCHSPTVGQPQNWVLVCCPICRFVLGRYPRCERGRRKWEAEQQAEADRLAVLFGGMEEELEQELEEEEQE